MHERGITEIEVEHAIASGRVIESYPNDTPCPSALLLGHAGTKAVHVVYADDIDESIRIIITDMNQIEKSGMTTSKQGEKHEVPYLQTRKYPRRRCQHHT